MSEHLTDAFNYLTKSREDWLDKHIADQQANFEAAGISSADLAAAAEFTEEDEVAMAASDRNENYSSHPGFIIDVPVTLSVTIRGEDLDEEKAKRIARDLVDGLQPGEFFLQGYCNAQSGTGENLERAEITEATFESSAEDECEVLDVLDAIPESGK